ncbi:glycine zipper 2TM domain-containing protein [Kiritimatiellota bacterium B12222]|nr:glycine zipper 2TM domain-containing protein [Kiritimatiellota bacterium B12222]
MNTTLVSRLSVLSVIGLGLLTSGCQTPAQSGTVYTPEQAQQSMVVLRGTIVSVDAATIQGAESGAGAVIGAVAGGVLGSVVGGGDGQTAAEVGGALAGGAVGSTLENRRKRSNAWTIEVKLTDGSELSVVQAQEKGVVFSPGQSVKVLQSNDGTMRVTH